MEEKKYYKVVQLKAENFKRLKAIDITPDPDEPVIEITGKNAQGKSAILDSIAYAMGGGKYVPEMPIRRGEKKSLVYLDLGGLKITKVSTASGERLEVTNAEGLQYKSGQAVLDKIRGRTIDPMAFCNLKDEEQKKILLELVDLDIDLDALAAQRKERFDNRTEQGRFLKQLEAEIKALPEPEEGLPVNELSSQPIMDEIEQARKAEEKIREKKGELEDVGDRINATNERINIKREAIKQLKAKIMAHEIEIDKEIKLIEGLAEQGEKAQKELVALPAPSDQETIKAKWQEIELTNRKIRDNLKRQALVDKAIDKKNEIENLSIQLSEIDQTVENALQNANFPIPGLGFSETGITYNGIPFNQSAKTEKMRTSMSIAMAKNPDFRVILVQDASLYDSESRAIVREMAQEKDYSVWEEIVDETGEVGVYIEDGKVKKVNKPRKKKTSPELPFACSSCGIILNPEQNEVYTRKVGDENKYFCEVHFKGGDPNAV